jgi:transposase
VPAFEGLSREELVELASEQARRIEAQARQIEELTERLARVERLLSRNSRSSSMPPSGDDQPGKPAPKSEPERGKDEAGRRRPGKRRGEQGRHLRWSEAPDDTVPHHPTGRCGCGSDLAGAEDVGVAFSRQEHEIPLVSARVVQHDMHAARCRCGTVHQASPPAGLAEAPVSYRVNLRAWCVYLLVVHAVPAQRCAQIVESLTGAKPSTGFVHGLIRRTAEAVEAVDTQTRTLVTLAHAVCCDETPIRVGAGKAKRYLLVACTRLYTWYMLGDRTLATFKAFVLAELTGVVVHDRYQNYDSAEVGEHLHQLCRAHLLRDLEDAAEVYPDSHWPGQTQDALRGLIHAANTAREQGLTGIDEQTKTEYITWFRRGVRVGLSEVPPAAGSKDKAPAGRCLLEVLRDREVDVLRFAHDLDVPPTSNDAERDLRPAKTQQKISGRLRSEETTKARYRIRGYTSTAGKHGVDVLAALRDALLGRPWTPPIPTPT